MAYTDTQLRQRWEAVGGRADADAEHERDTIRREWRELLELKRQGKLTDETHVKEVERITLQATALHVKVKLERGEFQPYDPANYVSHLWGVVVTPEQGPDFDVRRWHRLMNKVEAELASLDYVIGAGDYKKIHGEEPPESGQVARVIMVDVWVWGGPD